VINDLESVWLRPQLHLKICESMLVNLSPAMTLSPCFVLQQIQTNLCDIYSKVEVLSNKEPAMTIQYLVLLDHTNSYWQCIGINSLDMMNTRWGYGVVSNVILILCRFSLLLLEPGEIYFEDFAAIYHLPEDVAKKEDGWETICENGQLRGRLKVCSKSLVFDPRDTRAPIIKFPLRSFESVQESQGEAKSELLTSDGDRTYIEVKCGMIVEMLEGNVLQPYRFCREVHSHTFELVYVKASTVLPQVCQLQRASTLPPNDQNTMIQAIVRSRQRRKKFDRSLLEDISETVVLESQANKVTPLVTNPGTVLLTTSTLYFQPHNNAEKFPVIRIGLHEIRQVIKRRFLLRQVVVNQSFPSSIYASQILVDESINPAVISVSVVRNTWSWLPLIRLPIVCSSCMGYQLEIRGYFTQRHLLDIGLLTLSGFIVNQLTKYYILYMTAIMESEERDNLYECLMHQENVSVDDMRQDNISYQWQAGAISNFEYLSYLNSQADRSVNDLTQYPVFPWVLADYVSESLDLGDPAIYRDLSKPVGALNECRLKRLKERCKDMPEPRFLYGSHYSTPGFVLFYLVRQYPQYMLCLQNGRFDHPDRMFNSLPDTWYNVTTNPSDFKELIPEFYDLDGSADFLTNSMQINFGVRQNGKPVGDVELPPWAKGPETVIKTMRDALESEYVSQNLHLWIDLIFGYKQNGEEAEKADNLFYHLCYEGSVDLAAITDLNDRLALEVQITEFGQVPKQLFSKPHPQRSRSFGVYDSMYLSNGISESSICSEAEEERADSGENNENKALNPSSTCLWQRLADLRLLRECRAHREAITGVVFTTDSQNILSVGQDALLKMYTLPKLNQVRSVRISSMAASSCLHLPGTDTVLVGSWDNTVYKYSLEFSQVHPLLEAHCDAVSCMQWNQDVLVTGSWDCTVRTWSLEIGANGNAQRKERDNNGRGKGGSMSAGENILCEMDHDSPVTCVALHPAGSLLASGTQDGTLAVWLLPAGDLVHQISCHTSSVNAIAWSDNEDRVLTAGDDGLLTIVDAHQGNKICIHDLQENIRCVAWEGRLVIGGSVSGDVIVFDMGTGAVIKRLTSHTGPVTCLAISPDNQHLVTVSEDRRIILWGTD
ncbi:protein FAN-like, partial [Penaeus indicus]|uniref:protein FAN-like n=1 Tax=Penaeus indicus TaxID=29960 RepID=UPI00300C7736